jgi:hypothetical protein
MGAADDFHRGAQGGVSIAARGTVSNETPSCHLSSHRSRVPHPAPRLQPRSDP